MSFDPVTYSAVQQLKKEAVDPKYEYIWSSRSITASRNAELTIRAMGAGGGGNINATGALRRGGSGGTVALKTLNVVAGDTLNVTIPAGGSGGITASPAGESGGTLQVQLNGSDVLTITGGSGGGGDPASDPTGADWFVKSTVPTGSGGGSAMLLEGFGSTGTATGAGGAGVLGNGGALNGGGIMYDDGGNGFALIDMTVLRFTENIPRDKGVAFTGGIGTAAAGGFGSGGGTLGIGGFGGGGGGTAAAGAAGDGGFGGGGGGSGSIGGAGGQGFVTLEWRYT